MLMYSLQYPCVYIHFATYACVYIHSTEIHMCIFSLYFNAHAYIFTLLQKTCVYIHFTAVSVCIYPLYWNIHVYRFNLLQYKCVYIHSTAIYMCFGDILGGQGHTIQGNTEGGKNVWSILSKSHLLHTGQASSLGHCDNCFQ